LRHNYLIGIDYPLRERSFRIFCGQPGEEIAHGLGEVTVRRAYYYDKECRTGFCPKDNSLETVATGYSPGVRRLMSKVGAMRPFGLGHQDLYELADIRVNAKEVERQFQIVGGQIEMFHCGQAETALSDKVVPIRAVPRMYVSMDGTGVPVVKRETADRRGMDRAGEICVIGDGALWIWNIADEHFYGACQIVDLYHAREHYWTVARACFKNKDEQNKWAEVRRLELNGGNVEEVIEAI
jgi:hypothetical protein